MLSTMPRPCGAIDCGYAVISTNHCKTFKSAYVITVERAKHIFRSHETWSLKDFLTTKNQGGGRQKIKGAFKVFRGAKAF